MFYNLVLRNQSLLSQPYNSSDKLPVYYKRVGTITLRKPLYLKLPMLNLSVLRLLDLIRMLISETVPTIKNLEKLPTRTLISKLPSFGTLQVDTACSLINWWHTNYYHWFMQSLINSKDLNIIKNKLVKAGVSIPSNLPRWKIESLRLLGWGRWLYTVEYVRIKVERLVVPSFRHGLMD